MRKYTNLVFDGGGARGIAYCGALKVLEKYDLMRNVKCLAGTSVGSIFASAIAVGYTSDEIQEILLEKNFSDFCDNSRYLPMNFYYFLTQYGWYRGEKLMQWVGELLAQKTGNADITLGEVLEKYGKELVIVGANLNLKKAIYFNPKEHPNLRVKEAVRISASIPFFFDAYQYEGNRYVDGGILDSYPFDYFPNDEATLGFKLKFKLINLKETKDVKIRWYKDFLEQFMKTVLNKIEQVHVKDHYWKQTVELDAMDVGITDFEIPLKKKLDLIKVGVKATKAFLQMATATETNPRHSYQIKSTNETAPINPSELTTIQRT